MLSVIMFKADTTNQNFEETKKMKILKTDKPGKI